MAARGISERLIVYSLIGLGVFTVLHPWFIQPGVPITIRGENAPEINYIWMIRNLIASGHPFSAWNDKFLGGEAALTHAAYPFYWLIALVSWLTQIPVEGIYPFIVAGLLTVSAIAVAEYVYLLTGRSEAALVAGLISALIPGRFNTIEGLYIQTSWAWIPIILWLYQRDFAQRTLPTHPARIRLGLAYGLMAWTSIQILLMSFLVLGPYVLWREWQASADFARHNKGDWWHWLRQRFSAWLWTGAVAIGIAVSYYIPTLIDFTELGFSAYLSDPSGVTVPLDFVFFMLTFRWSPEFFPGRWHHLTWYLGGVGILLSVCGVLFYTRQRRQALFWLLMALFSLLLLVGDSLGSVPNLIYHAVDQLPVLNGTLRRSFRFVVPLSLSIAILAGMGTATLVGWLVRWKRSGALVTLMLAGLVVFDLFPHHGSFRVLPSYLRADESAVIDWLQQQDAHARYLIPFNYSLDDKGYLLGYNLSYAHHLVPQQGIWEDSYIGHFTARRAVDMMGVTRVDHPQWQAQMTPQFHARLALSSIRYLILFIDSPANLSLYESAIAQGFPEIFTAGDARILEVPQTQALVQVYPYAAQFGGHDLSPVYASWLPVLAAAGTALLEDTAPTASTHTDFRLQSDTDLALLPPAGSAPNAVDTLTWTTPSPSSTEINVTLNRPATLVIANAWFPGWQVTVDGESRPLLRANYAFQGVQLAAGEHQVRFFYQPPIYVMAANLLSATVLVGSLLYLIFGGRRLFIRPIMRGRFQPKGST